MPETATTKASWTTVSFGDVVRQVKDKVDPWKSGLERYVAGEHMDSEDLRIRRWGEIGHDYLGPAFHMRFRPGHVLYGSRRTYLRKVVVADFEGITANTTYVLESRDPEVLLPELLPFIMQAEPFHAHSKRESRGSVNPYVNFSDLARYEFALPPLEEQRRISEVLQAAISEVHALQDAELHATLLRRAFLVDVFRPDRGVRDTFPAAWSVRKARELGDIQLGQQRHPKYKRGDNVRPYLRVANVFDGFISLDDVLEMHFPKDSLDKFELHPGDILLNEGQSTELVGRSAIYRGEIEGCCFQKTLLRYRCGEELLPDFAHAFFQHCLYTGQFARMVVQTTSMAHLTAVRFKTFQMPQPPLEEQREIVSRLVAINDAAEAVASRTLATKDLVARLIERTILRGC